MEKRYFTIGMAGHIDHGKTTLTKALTNIDTDRLKEEKERQISIELGFARLYEDDKMQISVVDVPGHERFIRQMIAGVAGIDLVVLVVAADEGVMPQTKEHLDILSFLGIKTGIVAITKVDLVDDELLKIVQEDLRAELSETTFAHAPFVFVDSLKKTGINQLKTLIIQMLQTVPMRDIRGDFRLPIDQVFSMKGQGQIVRGTVYEGMVHEGEQLTILPNNTAVRVRQIQVHHQRANIASAGQRAAINIVGSDKGMVARGDVLVSSTHFPVTTQIDVSLMFTKELNHEVKQRMPIKCHIGTSEVMGKIIFFDRNKVENERNEVLCQLRLDEPIVAKRGDRFILRRPSPAETIGGGWVIDPNGQTYRFGHETIVKLQRKKEGTKEERLLHILEKEKGAHKKQLLSKSPLLPTDFNQVVTKEGWIEYGNQYYTHITILQSVKEEIKDNLTTFHQNNPMHKGVNKAELIQSMRDRYPVHLLEYALQIGEKHERWKRDGQYVAHINFRPQIPQQWQKRVKQLLQHLQKDDWQTANFDQYFHQADIPDDVKKDISHYLIENNEVIQLDTFIVWHHDVFSFYMNKLKKETAQTFETKSAKDILGFSRKYLIPFLERLDEDGYTKREGNKRIWLLKG